MNTRNEAEQGEGEHGGKRGTVGLVRTGGDGGARPPEERDTEGLDETGSRERGGERQHGADGGNEELETPRRQRRAEQDGLKGEPLGNETVERGQRRDGGTAGEKGKGCERHVMNEPAQMFHVTLARGIEHRAGAKE